MRAALCGAVSVAVALAAPLGAQAAGPRASQDPAHPYRHGIQYTTDWARAHHAAGAASTTGNLAYGGGIGGVGVTTGAPRIYVVFWGSQWGTQGTDSQGNLTFSGDPQGMAPRYQAMFKGLGAGNELWSGVDTQYCDGVATGSTSCPSNSSHVGYPTGGAFAGAWADESAAAPNQATGNQIGQEAVNAAAHFGNTSSTANRSVQYAIVSPTGTHPDGFNTIGANWCAWHDYTGDSTLSGGAVSSPYGNLAFTNMPYVTDMGTSCGQNFVNAGSAGTLDGVTIVGGHEYAETITDQFPAGGWTDSGGSENGDKCAWISSGQGASANVSFTTGTFAMQSTWANDYNSGAGGCEMSHPIVTNSATNDFSLSVSPAGQTVNAGSSTTYTVSTSVTSGSATSVTLSASGLPSGATASFSPNPVTAGSSSTMTVATSSTTPAGTSTLTVTGNNGSTSHSSTASLTVNSTTTTTGVTNGGFETGNLSGWTPSGAATGVSTTAHSGSYSALVGSTSPTNGDSSIAQTFTVPSTGGNLSFWYRVTCPDTVTYDWATATLKDNTAGTTSTVLAKTCTNTGSWVHVSTAVTAGHSLTLTLTSHDDNYAGDATYTNYDDVAIVAPVANPVTNGGFETGSLSGWTASGAATGVSTTAHSGTYSALPGSTSPTSGDSSIAQTFTIPSGASTLSFWYRVTCPDTVTYDWATATLKDNTAGTTTTVLAKTCTNSGAWAQASYSVSSIAGHSVTLTLTSHDDNYAGDATYTNYDDVAVS